MFGTSPGEAASVVTTDDVERGVAETGVGWVEHAHEYGEVQLQAFSATRQSLRCVHQRDGRRIRLAADRLHERRASFGIPVHRHITLLSLLPKFSSMTQSLIIFITKSCYLLVLIKG